MQIILSGTVYRVLQGFIFEIQRGDKVCLFFRFLHLSRIFIAIIGSHLVSTYIPYLLQSLHGNIVKVWNKLQGVTFLKNTFLQTALIFLRRTPLTFYTLQPVFLFYL